MNLQVYTEATLVGILVTIAGIVVASVISLLPRSSDPKQWNQYYIMQISLFLSGMIVHLGCEYTGLNRLYCIKGSACR